MSSRLRIATAAGLVACGLLIGSAGGALALAEPDQDGSTEQAPDDDTPRDDKPGPDRSDDEKGGADDGGREDPGAEDDGEQTPTATDRPEPTKTPPPTEPEQPCETKDDECGPGGWWPWWPWPKPTPRPPGEAPGAGGGGSGVAIQPPAARPKPPEMQLPAELLPPTEPGEPPEPLSAVPGVAVPAPGLPPAPISLPVVAAPAVGTGAGPAPVSPPLPRAPRVVEAEPPAPPQPPPAGPRSNASGLSTPSRAGYTDYLRTAGISQLVALAAPGLAGILVLTGVGGLVGYRQAKAGHAVRARGAARFVN